MLSVAKHLYSVWKADSSLRSEWQKGRFLEMPISYYFCINPPSYKKMTEISSYKTPHSFGFSGFASSLRIDKWWVEPLLIVAGLLAFIIYTSLRAWQGGYYWFSNDVHGFGGYISPLYSPPFFIDANAHGCAPIEHSWFGGTDRKSVV